VGLGRVIAVALVGVFLLPVASGAQGLGDASKKEKQRRETGKAAPAKTYTQEQLLELPPVANEGAGSASEESAAAPAAPPPKLGPTPPAAGDEESARNRDEERWRVRVAAARARVDKAHQAHETLSGMNLVPGYEYVDDKGRTVIGSVKELQKLTARAKAELTAAERALEALLEEARRANVPPGWLR
jgi:hypothetical protein